MKFDFLSNQNFMYVLLGIISIVIFALIMTLFFYFYEKQEEEKFSNRIKKYNEEFYLQTLKDIQSHKVTRTLYEKLDLLLSKSQLKYKYSWNIPLFLGLIFSLFFIGYFGTYERLGGFILSFVIGLIGAMIPFLLLEIIANRNGKKLKSQILSFIPVLINNAKLTGGDVFKTIKKSVEKVNDPLKTYLNEFIEEYENGVSPFKCFNNLRYKISDFRFTRIIDCLETHLYKGGNVVVTLGSINKEYLARDIEEDRRRKANSATSIGIYATVVGNFIILYITSLVFPEIIEILKQHQFIIVLILINIVLSLIIAYAATKMQRKKGA